MVLKGENHCQHYVSGSIAPYHHVAEKTCVFPDVVELQTVAQGIVLHEEPDSVGWLLLKPAMLDIQNFVEESSYMETESAAFFRTQAFRILVSVDPPFGGECEFQLVAVVSRVVRRDYRRNLRYAEMSYPHELVIYLLLFGLELHFVGEMLPFAASAYSEMLAERLRSLLGRLYH